MIKFLLQISFFFILKNEKLNHYLPCFQKLRFFLFFVVKKSLLIQLYLVILMRLIVVLLSKYLLIY